ncbi:MAG: hypothetical protein ACO1TE_10390 [Prosthecobacter sp.]
MSVTARATAIKGVVMASTAEGGERQLSTGDTIRGGTVVQSRAEAGALFRPSSNSALVVYPSSKVRFDGATVSPGHENVTCTIMEGKAWFSVGQTATAAEGGASGEGTTAPSSTVKITVVTEQGVIEGKAGNWTVQHDEGRTMVAVGEGKSVVSIGGAAGAASGGVTGQVEVPKGSVIWLYTREGGVIEAEVVNTANGTVMKVGPGGTLGSPTKADANLLADSKNGLTTPSSEGGTQQLPTTTGGQPNNTPPTQNPDFSTPTPNVPVVSSETP